MESYVERPPLPGLAGVVRTVWIQRTGEAAYVQRHLPTGGVEMHLPIGGHPQLHRSGHAQSTQPAPRPSDGDVHRARRQPVRARHHPREGRRMARGR
jgi:hypothetical protein